MIVLAVTAASLRRLVRDRTATFFLVLLPIVVIMVIGATMANVSQFRVGVVGASGGLAGGLASDLNASANLETVMLDGEPAARDAVRRGELEAALLVPDDLDARLRAGETVPIPMLVTGPQANQQAIRSAVAGVVATHAARIQAARFAADTTGGALDEQLLAVEQLQRSVPSASVRTETADSTKGGLPTGFGYSAPTMLVLFVFITSLTGGSAIIASRKLGIYERVMAAPVRARHVVLGETLSYFTVGLFQSLLIVVVGAVAFGVDWGDPLAAAALVVVWVLVGTGAGVLAGTLFRTPEQATAIGPALGIGLGMLGGTMWPLEIVPPFLRAAGHAVPQAWAVDGWTELLSGPSGIADIAPQLAVLGGFAVMLLVAASIRLRRRLTA